MPESKGDPFAISKGRQETQTDGSIRDIHAGGRQRVDRDVEFSVQPGDIGRAMDADKDRFLDLINNQGFSPAGAAEEILGKK